MQRKLSRQHEALILEAMLNCSAGLAIAARVVADIHGEAPTTEPPRAELVVMPRAAGAGA